MEDKLATTIIVLLAVSLLIVAGMKFYEGQVQADDAADYVLEDLAGKHPGADSVEIMDWETCTNPEGEEYRRIRASVTDGLYSPCPVRTHYFYHYPIQNFIADAPEYITDSGCMVCEGKGCAIAFPEEAIIASHTNSGTENVHKYATGYADAVPSVYKTDGGWRVAWNSDYAKYGYFVEIAKNGEIEKVETIYY